VAGYCELRNESWSSIETGQIRDEMENHQFLEKDSAPWKYPVPGNYKYGDLALQVGGVSNLRQ
jgi:hypothetical protein